MNWLRLAVVVIGLAILLTHFFVTDPLRNTEPLNLKISTGIQSIDDADTAELEAISKPVQRHLSEVLMLTNQERLFAGIVKWIGISLTVLLMLIAGAFGVTIAGNNASSASDLATSMKEQMKNNRRLQISVALISAAIAATNLVGSNLEMERVGNAVRAKDIQSSYYAARKAWRDSKKDQREEHRQEFDDILMK